jgi:glycosyltransferase involved in cell wall biosynthesis
MRKIRQPSPRLYRTFWPDPHPIRPFFGRFGWKFQNSHNAALNRQRRTGMTCRSEWIFSVQISIVTAVYNRAATVGQAIQSVAAQDCGLVEHLVIDGGSTDGTLERIEQHRHPGLSVFSGPDGGIYDALNKGIARATGDVVGLLHSDDFFADARVLSRVSAAFAATGADAVYGDLQYVAADDPERVIRHWKAGAFSPVMLQRGWMPPHPTLFLRREVFDRLGDYDTSYRIAADYEAVLRWFGHGGITSTYIPEVLVRMRVGGESNRSLSRIIRKSREDYRALRTNRIGGFPTLIFKNISKIPQFLKK